MLISRACALTLDNVSFGDTDLATQYAYPEHVQCALTLDNVSFGDTEPFDHNSLSQLCCGRYVDTFFGRFEYNYGHFNGQK